MSLTGNIYTRNKPNSMPQQQRKKTNTHLNKRKKNFFVWNI